MTEEKVCPIMSRPSQGNMTKMYSSEPLYESEDEMKKYGWTPIDGKPYSDVVHCLREKCMAFCPKSNWTDGTKRNDEYCKMIGRR